MKKDILMYKFVKNNEKKLTEFEKSNNYEVFDKDEKHINEIVEQLICEYIIQKKVRK